MTTKKRKPLIIEQHLKRYHKSYYEKFMIEMEESAKGMFDRGPQLQTVHFPAALPFCKTLNECCPFGTYTSFEIGKKK